MCVSMADIQSATAEIRRGKKEEEEDEIGGYDTVVHGRPKTPKNTSFWGHPAPRGRTAPIFYGTQLDPDM